MKKITLVLIKKSLILGFLISGNLFANSRYPFEAKPFDGVALEVAISHRNYIPILVAGYADEYFSIGQLEILNQAIKILIGTAMTDESIDCAFENSDRDQPESRTKFIEQLFNVFTIRLTGDLMYPGHLYIAYEDSPLSHVGTGYVNLFYSTTHPWPGYSTRRYTYISINSRYLGKGANYTHSTDPKYWAGVIAHEILHNLGYSHPSGYRGSFIEEYGNCIAKQKINLSEKLIHL